MNSSLEWHIIESELIAKANTLANGRDVKRMIHNIGLSVNELSKAEVEARRGKKHKAQELLDKINEDINTVREYLLIAALLG